MLFISRVQTDAKQGVDWIEWRHLAPGSLFAWLDKTDTAFLDRYSVWLCLWNVEGYMVWRRRIGAMLVGGRRIIEFSFDAKAVAYRLHDDPVT